MVTTPTVWKSREQVPQSGTGDQNDAQIALGREDGGWYVVWVDGTTSALMARSFDAEGNALTGDVSIGLPGNDTDPAVALLPGDILAVAFANDEFGDNDILVRQVDKMLGVVGLQLRSTPRSARRSTLRSPCSVAATMSFRTPSGRVTTPTWRSAFSTERPLTPRFRCLTETTIREPVRSRSALSNGDFVVVFQDEFRRQQCGSRCDVRRSFRRLEPLSIRTTLCRLFDSKTIRTSPHSPAAASSSSGVTTKAMAPDDPGIKARVYNNAGDCTVPTTSSGQHDHRRRTRAIPR